DMMVFDKTGTLTLGRPTLTDVIPAPGVAEDDVLAFAAAAEQGSEHPIGEAVVKRAKERGLPMPAVAEFSTVPGRGIDALAPEGRLLLGSRALVEARGGDVPALAARAEAPAEAGRRHQRCPGPGAGRCRHRHGLGHRRRDRGGRRDADARRPARRRGRRGPRAAHDPHREGEPRVGVRLQRRADPGGGGTALPALGRAALADPRRRCHGILVRVRGDQLTAPEAVATVTPTILRPTANMKGANMTDPVCKMTVEPAKAAAQSSYKGQTYYFCAVGCKQKFDREPEKYLAGGSSPMGTGQPGR